MLYNPDCFCSLSVDIGIRGRGAKRRKNWRGGGEKEEEEGQGHTGTRQKKRGRGGGRVDMAVRMCVRRSPEEGGGRRCREEGFTRGIGGRRCQRLLHSYTHGRGDERRNR